jgi:hypothetical protein
MATMSNSNNKPTQNWGIGGTAKSWVNPFFATHHNLNDEINRIYGENLNANKNEVQAGGDFLSKDYQNTIDQLNQGLQSDTQKLNANEASSGTWSSGARAERANSLANTYNNKYKSAYDTSAYKTNTLGSKYQPDLGMEVQNQLPTINQYQVSPTGGIQTGQSYKYNPFQQAIGGLEAGRNYAAKQIIY